MKTLMHICCAPCANRPIESLRQEGMARGRASGTIPISTPRPSTAAEKPAWRTTPGRSPSLWW